MSLVQAMAFAAALTLAGCATTTAPESPVTGYRRRTQIKVYPSQSMGFGETATAMSSASAVLL